MIPEIGRAGLRIGLMLIIPCAIMVFFQQPGTPAWAITWITLIMGVVFTLGVLLLAWIANH